MSGKGDCYEVAGNAVFEDALPARRQIVHGTVSGQGHLTGVRFGHAWVEVDDTVFDLSNGRAIIMPRDEYYALGEISNPRRYTVAEARKLMLAHEHYGPWHEEEDNAPQDR